MVILAGAPGSGKDLLIKGVRDLGKQHAEIVPKHTSRTRRHDDGDEMICSNDEGYDLEHCDVRYDNYTDRYGLQSAQIWTGLQSGSSQVLVVSNPRAINQLRGIFRDAVSLVYVHGEMSAAEYKKMGSAGKTDEYVRKRVKQYEDAEQFYLSNVLAFDHVLIAAGPPEDLYDQIFRLFRAFRNGAS